MAAKDERLALTGELLRGIRALKMLGWEDAMAAKVCGHAVTQLRSLCGVMMATSLPEAWPVMHRGCTGQWRGCPLLTLMQTLRHFPAMTIKTNCELVLRAPPAAHPDRGRQAQGAAGPGSAQVPGRAVRLLLGRHLTALHVRWPGFDHALTRL